MALLKQKELLRLIAENDGKPSSERKSLRQLILDAGYSQTEADNPKRILETKTWTDLVEELLPDDEILKRLHENATQRKSYLASNQAIDTIIKIKGKYAPNKVQVISPEDDMSDEQLDNEIKRLEEKVKTRKTAQNSSKTDENSSKQVENGSEHDENIIETKPEQDPQS